MEWERLSISSVAEVISGGTPKTDKPEYWDGDIPWLSVRDFAGDQKYVYDAEKTITTLGLQKSATTLLDKDDIIISARGTVGEVALIPFQMAFNQSCFGLRAKKGFDPEFLYYVLKYQMGQVKTISNGAVFDTIIIKTFDKIKCCFPPFPTQQKIASILSAYDSQIENNQKRIKLLEQMAENLYKEWFVRFRFPGYESAEFEGGVPKGWNSQAGHNKKPKGWEYGELKKLGSFARGKNITSSEMIEGNIPVISAGLEPSGYHNAANVSGPCLTISSSGANAGYLKYNLTDIWAADCSYYNNPENVWFVYSALKYLQPVISNMQCGSAQPHVYPKDVNRLCVVLPPPSLVKIFNQQCQVIFDEILNVNKQIDALTRQRDLLLPRLMSGKLEVKGE